MAASVIADDVLDGVARDADDHDAGERLRDAERLHGRVERVDEPVRDEGRGDAAQASTPIAQRERAVARCLRLLERRLDVAVGSQVRPEPGAVDGEQADRADDRDRDLVMARLVAEAIRQAEQRDHGEREQQERGRVVRQSLPELHRLAVGRGAPATIARPRTSRAFAKSEPRIEVWATTISPADSANRTMKSSGRLPSVDWSAPVTAGPKRAPTDSVATPISQASPPRATPRDDEDRRRRRARVVERACDRADRGDRRATTIARCTGAHASG